MARIIILISLFGIFSSCSKEDKLLECPELDQPVGVIEINEKDRSLLVSEIRIDEIPGLMTHEFLIESIGDNCNEIFKLRFYITTPSGGPIEGTYDVFPTAVFTADKMTSLAYTIQTLEPLDFYIEYATEGTATITAGPDDAFTIRANATLEDGEELSFEQEFELE